MYPVIGMCVHIIPIKCITLFKCLVQHELDSALNFYQRSSSLARLSEILTSVYYRTCMRVHNI